MTVRELAGKKQYSVIILLMSYAGQKKCRIKQDIKERQPFDVLIHNAR